MPKEWEPFIGARIISNTVIWVIGFARKDNKLDICGFTDDYSKDALMKACTIKSLKDFDKEPLSWNEIEPIKLVGLWYKHA